MTNTRSIVQAAILCSSLVLAACGSIGTEVRTVSDATPPAGSTYALQPTAAQASDSDAERHARALRAALAGHGFRETSAAEAEYHVTWQVTDRGQDIATRPTVHSATQRRTTVHSSQATLAGVPVPGTRRTTVHHDSTTGVHADETTRVRQHFEASVQFVRTSDGRPVHKVVASTETRRKDLHAVAPCLLEAAMAGYPNPDGSNQRESVDCG